MTQKDSFVTILEKKNAMPNSNESPCTFKTILYGTRSGKMASDSG